MLYKNDIANLTLNRLGVSLALSDFDTEQSKEAKLFKRHFPIALEQFLIKHPWTFATTDRSLALEDTLENEYSPLKEYQYAVPADCLIIRQMQYQGVFYNVEEYPSWAFSWREIFNNSGRSVISTLEYAHVRMTKNISADDPMPTYFGDGLAAFLVARIAPSLILNNYAKVAAPMIAEARNDISLAIAHDLSKQPQPEAAPSSFVSARY